MASSNARESSDAGRPVWLESDDPRVLLGRLLVEDPLEVRGRARRRVEARSLLLDSQRVALRALVTIAYARKAHVFATRSGPWIDQRIDDAIHQLIEADRAAECEGGQVAGALDERYLEPCRLLGLEAARARAVAIAFNQLDEPVRRAFYRLVLLQEPLPAFLARERLPPMAVRSHLLAVARALTLVPEPGLRQVGEAAIWERCAEASPEDFFRPIRRPRFLSNRPIPARDGTLRTTKTSPEPEVEPS